MPIYEYQGQQYELPDGLTNEQAKNKILKHLGQVPAEPAPTPASAPVAPKQQSVDPAKAAWEEAVQAHENAPGIVEKLFGIGERTGLGAASLAKSAIVDPLIGISQLALRAPAMFDRNNIPSPDSARVKAMNWLDELNSSMNNNLKAAREAAGMGSDLPEQLVGGIVNPVSNKIGSALKAAPEASKLTKFITAPAAQGAGIAATTPVEGWEFDTTKVGQVVAGAGLGMSMSVVGGLASKLKGIVSGFSEQGKIDFLSKFLQEKIPVQDRPNVIKALQANGTITPGTFESSSSRLASVPKAAELVKELQASTNAPGNAGIFKEVERINELARKRTIEDVGGRASVESLKAARDAATSTLRNDALYTADFAGSSLKELSKTLSNNVKAIETAQADALGLLPATKTKEALSKNLQERNKALYALQEESLAQNGLFPLKATDIVSSLDKMMKNTTSDESKAVIGFIKDRVLQKADESGVVLSNDLYQNVRKDLNKSIADFLYKGQNYASGGISEEAAATANRVKSVVDAAINKSSNGLWSKYLDTYVEQSKKLNRKQVGVVLGEALGTPLDAERAGAFAKAVHDVPATFKSATGFPYYKTMSDVLTGPEVGAVNTVLKDLQNADSVKRMITNVKADNAEPIKTLPQFISKTITVINTGLRALQAGNKKEVDAMLGELERNPKALAILLSSIPPEKAESFASALAKRGVILQTSRLLGQQGGQ